MRRVVVVGLAWVVGAVVAAPVPSPEASWVTLKGRVVWPEARRLPDPRTFPDDQVRDKDHCCSDGPVRIEEVVVNPGNRGWANVAVWLRPDSDDKVATIPRDKIHPDLRAPKPAHHVAEYRTCQIRPRVTAARVGDTLEVRNPGPVADNFRADGNELTLNRLLPPRTNFTLDKPLALEKTPVRLKSDIHSWMTGYLRVFDHPYFAVTDADGRFEMRNVPVGKWRLVYWHEYGFHKGAAGRLGFPVTVRDEGKGTQSLTPWEFEYAE